MRTNVCRCLFLCVLGWNVGTEIIHEVVEEKKSVTLRCPQPVEGDVTWSRETNGRKDDILTTGEKGDRRYNDPGKRFNSQADKFKSLHNRRVNISDSGRYFCNDEPAADLTVIPPGTVKLTAAATTSVNLTCPPDVAGSHVPKWIRQNGGTNATVFSREPRTLTVGGLRLEDAGLYYCDGKAAAYLTVTGGQQSEGGGEGRGGASWASADVLLPAVLLPLLFIIIIISIILFIAWRRSVRRRGRDERGAEVVYAEVPGGSVFEPAQDGSNQPELTYSVIHHRPALENTTTTFEPNVPLYAVINKPRHHGENV